MTNTAAERAKAAERSCAEAPDDSSRDVKALHDELQAMREELRELRRSVSSPDGAPTSRRTLLRLAGVSAVGAVGATLATGDRTVSAADPNDVVKNTTNPVVAATILQGSMPTPILGLFNNASSGDAGALYMLSQSAAAPTVRADNDAAGGIGGVALSGNAPGGRDVHARGSGRIAMTDHAFGAGNQYEHGEIHQSLGTFYAMVTPTERRVLAAPGAAGALTAIDPRRVYDTRTPEPIFGRIASGQSRVIPVDHGRSIDTGAVTDPDLVPGDATVIVFSITVVNTVGNGFLSVTPAPSTSISASTVNWIGDGVVTANSAIVGLVGSREVRVHCGGSGSTDFALDVLGFHR